MLHELRGVFPKGVFVWVYSTIRMAEMIRKILHFGADLMVDLNVSFIHM